MQRLLSYVAAASLAVSGIGLIGGGCQHDKGANAANS
jgi:hypothetical protein